MSTPEALTPTNVREAVGIFFNATSAENTIADLKAQGFSSEGIGLLANRETVKDKLSHLYDEVSDHGPNEPKTAFVNKESVKGSTNSFVGSLSFIGAAALGSTAVASAALLGSPVLVGLAALAFGGGIAAVMGKIISKSDADYLKEQLDEGHILLFVRTMDPHRERLALEILSRHGAFDSKIIDVDGTSENKGFRSN